MKKYNFLMVCLILIWGCNSSSDHTNTIKTISIPIGNQLIREATVFEPKNISREDSEEYSISFTPDMKTLYFTSRRNGNQHFSIYTSSFVDGKWSPATLASFSGKFFEADAFVSLDGQRIYYFSMRPLGNDSIPLEMPNLWFVEKSNNGWSQPKYLSPLVNTDKSGEGYASLSRNNNLYFSSVGRDEGRKHDVYKAKLKNGNYENPEFVDINIETNFSNPYISPDEDFIIVDSKQKGGFGGGDLYICHKKDGKWQEPKNLGKLINTEKDEGSPSISPDGQWFFFSRDGDMYYISASELELD